MTDTEHDALHAALGDIYRYAEAEATHQLPPAICVAAADWIARHPETYTAMVNDFRGGLKFPAKTRLMTP